MSNDAEVDQRALERVGTMLDDKWSLETLVGVGGMAAVYSARHRNGARAAIKVLHPHLARYAEVRERFRREGYAANRVEHPGAVKVLDDDVIPEGPDAGTAYIVMEMLEGESLEDRLERGPPVDELEFMNIAKSVLGVLDAAHSHGVVHRDLKPENLFLLRDPLRAGPGPQVKVLDFGLARLLEGQAITTYGLVLGTPSFMSPEQAAGRLDEIDGRTDLFALGATGFRLRTGHRIHEADNAMDLVRKMAKLPAPRIQTVDPSVSEAFARVIDRSLEFRRDDRYPTAREMQKDVEKAIDELLEGHTRRVIQAPISSRSIHDGPVVEIGSGDLEPAPPSRPFLPRYPSSPIPPPPKRRSFVGWFLLLALCGVGGKLAFDRRAQLANLWSARFGSSAAPATAPSSTAAAEPASSAGPAPATLDAQAADTGANPLAAGAMPGDAKDQTKDASADAHAPSVAGPKAVPGPNAGAAPRKHRAQPTTKGPAPGTHKGLSHKRTTSRPPATP